MSHIRSTKGDSIFFRIPREKLRPDGLRRLLRLERYNNYKVALLAEAKQKGFTLPPTGLNVTFFIPMPRTWSKKKRKLLHGQFCQSRPDLDNLIKSLCDSLVSEDKFIANLSASKRWVDFPVGWIECILTDEPMVVLVQPPSKGG
jgi:Holliday junction resolvase RusA-like endonuclease